MSRQLYCLALIALSFLFAPALSASTVLVFDVDGDAIQVGNGRQYTVEATCSGADCVMGIFQTKAVPLELEFRPDEVTGFSGDRSGDLDQLKTWLQVIDPALGIAPGAPDPTITSIGNSFTTNREYFSVYTQGQGGSIAWTAFFRNVSGGLVTVDLAPGSSYRLAEYGAFVPLPAAAWLFGSAVLALLGLGYRRKSASKRSHGAEAAPA